MSLCGVYRYSRFLSAGYIDTHKKLVNFTPFLDDKQYMKIGVRIQFLSAEYIDILKKLVNTTPFFLG